MIENKCITLPLILLILGQSAAQIKISSALGRLAANVKPRYENTLVYKQNHTAVIKNLHSIREISTKPAIQKHKYKLTETNADKTLMSREGNADFVKHSSEVKRQAPSTLMITNGSLHVENVFLKMWPSAHNRVRRSAESQETTAHENEKDNSWTTETVNQVASTGDDINPEDDNKKATDRLIEVFDKSQLVMVVVGLAANLVTVTTLAKNGHVFQPAILTLLRHQSGVDAWICGIGTAMLVQTPMWKTNNYVVDWLVCHIWHGQGTYWTSVTISVWNLVLISFERYLAVCLPFKHVSFTTKWVKVSIGMVYLGSLLILGPGLIQVSLSTEGTCVSEYAVKGQAGKMLFYVYSIFSFLTIYAIPCALFFILYGMIIITFKRRQSQSQFASSRVIDKATTELTKTAVVVTAIFIISIGYDLWYYVLGYTGVVVYVKNTFIQKVGVLLASFNSVCNPFVYALLMPAYRKSVKLTLCQSCTEESPTDVVSKSTSNSTSIVSA